MEGSSQTVSKWNGETLVTTWTSESAIAGGAKVVRTERRSLSPDGKTMTVESVRGSRPALVMVLQNSNSMRRLAIAVVLFLAVAGAATGFYVARNNERRPALAQARTVRAEWRMIGEAR